MELHPSKNGQAKSSDVPVVVVAAAQTTAGSDGKGPETPQHGKTDPTPPKKSEKPVCDINAEQFLPAAGGHIPSPDFHEEFEVLDNYSGDVSTTWRMCTSGRFNCQAYYVDFLLGLDTLALPSANAGLERMRLCDAPDEGSCAKSSTIELRFTGKLRDEVDPGYKRKKNLKVKAEGVLLKYFHTDRIRPGTVQNGISLKDDLSQLEFIEDPNDEQKTYIRLYR